MKQKVIEFLQNLPKEKYDQFNEAFELYRKSEGKNFGVERSVNAAGFSERNLENLLYDLQKLYGITDVEKVSSIQLTVVSDQSEEDVESEKWELLHPEIAGLFKSILQMTPEDQISWGCVRQKQFGDFDSLLQLSFRTKLEEVSDCLTKVWEYMSTHVCIDENQDLKATEGTRPDDSHPGTPINDIDVNDNGVVNIDGKLGVDFGILKQENENLASENEDLQYEKDELEEENEVLKDELETLKSLPKIDAKSIRVEFPFLNEKECPDEFKILVADKITSWNEYLNCQVKLHEVEEGTLVLSEKELADLAALTIDNFRENQKIYDELNAYAETGKVLGLHPIFKRLQLTREVEAMTPAQLNNYKGSSAKYFSYNRTSLAKAEKAKNMEKIELITNRVVERELKLALVNKKLGINPK
jgi:hypothetical protein